MEQNKYELDTLGFTVVPGVLSADLVSQARERLLEVTDEQNRSLSASIHTNDQWMVHNLMFKGQVFLDVLHTPELVELLDYSLGDTSIIYAYQSSTMPPQSSNYSNRIHVDSPRWIQGYSTNMGAIFALDDFTENSGATYFLPGSHLNGGSPGEVTFKKLAIRSFCKAGDLIFFNARTFHSGGMNTLSKPRAAITINFCRAFMRQRFNFPEMTPSEIEPRLSQLQRRLLGYNVRMPKSLEEFYLPEDQRLYKSNQG